MYTAHIWYNCFQVFEPGLDALCECLLYQTEIILSDLLQHWENKVISFLVGTHMSALQNMLMSLICFMTLWTLVRFNSIRRDL
jgi:hypothetical protein